MLPAVLYYAAVYYQVHLRARKVGLVGIPRRRLPALRRVILDYGHLLLPIVVLITMLVLQFTALFAAFFSILSVIVISSLRRHTRMGIRDIIEALELGAKNTISTAIACAAVGFIVGSVGLSGLALLLTHGIVGLAGGMLLPTLLLAAGASLFLSMGLPTTSVYIISATLVAPALVEVGTSPLVAHLFCYYWGGVSAITPPVALAAYVGAGIAGANVMQTGFTAMRLGIAAYLVPFYFVYWPALVHWDRAAPLDVALALGGGAVAVFCMATIGERFLFRLLPYWKLVLLAAGIVLILAPGDLSHALAVLCAATVLVGEWRAQRQNSATATGENDPS
jgi:TRAP transporter 4TM/12TM fusion protein